MESSRRQERPQRPKQFEMQSIDVYTADNIDDDDSEESLEEDDTQMTDLELGEQKHNHEYGS